LPTTSCMRWSSRHSRWLSAATPLKASQMRPGRPVPPGGSLIAKSPPCTASSAARSVSWSRAGPAGPRAARRLPAAISALP
jgi:hypothetical protein